MAVDEVKVTAGFALSNRQLLATTVHIARHDPARVLREVEAKRSAIVRLADAAAHGDEWELAQDVLSRLAEAFADHPD